MKSISKKISLLFLSITLVLCACLSVAYLTISNKHTNYAYATSAYADAVDISANGNQVFWSTSTVLGTSLTNYKLEFDSNSTDDFYMAITVNNGNTRAYTVKKSVANSNGLTVTDNGDGWYHYVYNFATLLGGSVGNYDASQAAFYVTGIRNYSGANPLTVANVKLYNIYENEVTNNGQILFLGSDVDNSGSSRIDGKKVVIDYVDASTADLPGATGAVVKATKSDVTGGWNNLVIDFSPMNIKSSFVDSIVIRTWVPKGPTTSNTDQLRTWTNVTSYANDINTGFTDVSLTTSDIANLAKADGYLGKLLFAIRDKSGATVIYIDSVTVTLNESKKEFTNNGQFSVLPKDTKNSGACIDGGTSTLTWLDAENDNIVGASGTVLKIENTGTYKYITLDATSSNILATSVKDIIVRAYIPNGSSNDMLMTNGWDGAIGNQGVHNEFVDISIGANAISKWAKDDGYLGKLVIDFYMPSGATYALVDSIYIIQTQFNGFDASSTSKSLVLNYSDTLTWVNDTTDLASKIVLGDSTTLEQDGGTVTIDTINRKITITTVNSYDKIAITNGAVIGTLLIPNITAYSVNDTWVTTLGGFYGFNAGVYGLNQNWALSTSDHFLKTSIKLFNQELLDGNAFVGGASGIYVNGVELTSSAIIINDITVHLVGIKTGIWVWFPETFTNTNNFLGYSHLTLHFERGASITNTSDKKTYYVDEFTLYLVDGVWTTEKPVGYYIAEKTTISSVDNSSNANKLVLKYTDEGTWSNDTTALESAIVLGTSTTLATDGGSVSVDTTNKQITIEFVGSYKKISMSQVQVDSIIFPEFTYYYYNNTWNTVQLGTFDGFTVANTGYTLNNNWTLSSSDHKIKTSIKLFDSEILDNNTYIGGTSGIYVNGVELTGSSTSVGGVAVQLISIQKGLWIQFPDTFTSTSDFLGYSHLTLYFSSGATIKNANINTNTYYIDEFTLYLVDGSWTETKPEGYYFATKTTFSSIDNSSTANSIVLNYTDELTWGSDASAIESAIVLGTSTTLATDGGSVSINATNKQITINLVGNYDTFTINEVQNGAIIIPSLVIYYVDGWTKLHPANVAVEAVGPWGWNNADSAFNGAVPTGTTWTLIQYAGYSFSIDSTNLITTSEDVASMIKFNGVSFGDLFKSNNKYIINAVLGHVTFQLPIADLVGSNDYKYPTIEIEEGVKVQGAFLPSTTIVLIEGSWILEPKNVSFSAIEWNNNDYNDTLGEGGGTPSNGALVLLSFSNYLSNAYANSDVTNRATANYIVGNKITVNGTALKDISGAVIDYRFATTLLYIYIPNNTELLELIIPDGTFFIGAYLGETKIYFNPTTKLWSYKVTFNSNGGSDVDPVYAPITKPLSQPVNAPVAPTMDKDDTYLYTFEYWYITDENVPFDFATIISDNITLNAKYSAVEYKTITINRADSSKDYIFFTESNAKDKLAEVALTTDDATYIYSWETALPAELDFTDYTFTEIRTAYKTITINRADGETVDTIKFFESNKADKLAEIILTSDSDEYTYSWETPLPDELDFTDYSFTEERTAVEYTITITRAVGEPEEIKFTVENKDDKLAEVVLTSDGADYTYAWETAIPEELALQDYDFTEERTAVEYTITINRADGEPEEIKFTVENKVDKLAEIILTSDSDEYTYSWNIDLPEELELKDYDFTEERTAVEYTITITRADGETIDEIKFTVENKADKLAEVVLTTDGADYTYAWETAIPEELELQDYDFTEERTAIEYTITITRADGETIDEIIFTVENKADKFAEVVLTNDTLEVSYSWETDLPEELALQDYTFTEVETAIEYTITITRADGETIDEIKFTYINKADKLAEVVLTTDGADYTYAWETALPEELALQDYTFTEVRTAIEYTITINRADGVTIDEIKFTVENKADKLDEVVLTPNIDAQNGYAWETALPEELALQDYTFTEIYALVEYTITINRADGTTVDTIKFNYNNKSEKILLISLTTDGADYTYAWKTALPEELELKDYDFTEERTAVEYTITINRADGETVDEIKFTVENKADKLAEVVLTNDTLEVSYSWETALPEELALQDYTFTEVETAIEYTITITRADCETVDEIKFTYINKADKLAEVVLTTDGADYTYAWETAIPDELALQDYDFTEERTAVEYTITITRAVGQPDEIKFTVENKADKLAEVVLTTDGADYTYAWAEDIPESLELQDYDFTEERTAVEYTITINRADGETVDEIKFTVENKADKLAEVILTTDGADYTYSWAEDIPTELELKDYDFTEERTAVEYTITINRADGETVDEIKFTVENKADKLAEVVLTIDSDEYTYAWAEDIPTELALQNYTFTEIRTAVEYTITINRAEGQPVVIKFTVENKTEKFAEVVLTQNTVEYSYSWEDVLPLKLELLNYEFTEIKTAVEYTITINRASGKIETIKFNVENKVEKLAKILLTIDTDEFVYSFKETVPSSLELKDYTFTEVKTVKEYKITINVVGADVKFNDIVEKYGSIINIKELKLDVDGKKYTVTINGVEVTEFVVNGDTTIEVTYTDNTTSAGGFSCTGNFNVSQIAIAISALIICLGAVVLKRKACIDRKNNND